MKNAEKMKVEIWSDVACPFCFIGKHKFEIALEKFPHKEDVEVLYHSFQLNPNAKYIPGQSLNEMLAEHKGISIEQARELNAHVGKIASQVGLNFNFDSAKPANTFDAHRLIHLAAKHGLQAEAKEKLMVAYFIEGLVVSDKNTLIKIGSEIGLPRQEIETMLSSDAMGYEVATDIQEANTLGISGVPFFVFNRKYAISGAQQPEMFLQALEKSWSEWNPQNAATAK